MKRIGLLLIVLLCLPSAMLAQRPADYSQVRLSDGTAGAPALAILSDPDTGVYSCGANLLCISTGGTERLRIGSAGQLTSTGVFTVNSTSGSHAINGGANQAQVLSLSNSTSGTAATSIMNVVAGTTTTYLESVSQGFTTANSEIAGSTRLLSNGAGGLVYVATDAAGFHRWYTQTTEQMRLSAAGLLTVNGFGTHTLGGNGTGAQLLKVSNASAGSTTDSAGLQLDVDAAGVSTTFKQFSASFTTSGANIQGGSQWLSGGVGGLALVAVNGAGTIKFYAGGSTEQLRLHASGGLSLGSTTDPGAGNFSATGTVTATHLTATTNITAGGGIIGSSSARGTSAAGFAISAGRNTSGGGAPGIHRFIDKAGSTADLWVDTTGVLRIGGGPVEGTADTGGTIVGTQTSTLDTKILLGNDLTPSEALATILATPVKHFRYKGGSYNGSEFHGIIADWSPEFAMDPEPAHPNGRSFNPVNGLGFTIQAIKALNDRIEALEAK